MRRLRDLALLLALPLLWLWARRHPGYDRCVLCRWPVFIFGAHRADQGGAKLRRAFCRCGLSWQSSGLPGKAYGPGPVLPPRDEWGDA